MTNAPACRFCAKPDPLRIALVSKYFYVLFSLGPIIEGYTLIVSNDHTSCCAAISEQAVIEFMALQRAVSIAQQSIYGCSTYYEHGRTGSCLHDETGGTHCYHAHLHLVPTPLSVVNEMRSCQNIIHIPDWDAFRTLYRQSKYSYILAKEKDGLGIAFNPTAIRRQYLRSIVANFYGKPDLADWIKRPDHELIQKAIIRLGPEIRKQASLLNIDYYQAT